MSWELSTIIMVIVIMIICSYVQVNDSPVHRPVRMNPCRCITLTRAYRTYGVRDDRLAMCMYVST